MIGSSSTLPKVMINPVMARVTQTIAIVQCAYLSAGRKRWTIIFEPLSPTGIEPRKA